MTIASVDRTIRLISTGETKGSTCTPDLAVDPWYFDAKEPGYGPGSSMGDVIPTGSPRQGEPDGGPAHPAQAPVDEDRLPGPDSRRGLVGGHAHGRQRGGLPVRKVHRFEHDRLLLGRHHLGERPRLPEPSPAEHRVAGLQAGDAGADRLDDPGEVVTHRPGKRTTGHQLHLAVAHLPVQRVGSRRPDADENLIRARSWWLELREPHHLRAAVAVVLKALHEAYSFEISVA